MRVHIIQHSTGTPPGTVLEWLQSRSIEHTISRLFQNDPLPSLESFDFLILLGGGMNVDEVEKYPWLVSEKEFIRSALTAHKTCLGLCLGGQLLSQVLGGSVHKHEFWESGWHTVLIGSDLRLQAFQWHQDTFSLPPGAVRVATNRITENQGFAYEDFVVGLQFHPEATESWINELLSDQVQPTGPHAQKPEQILENMVFLQPMKKWFFDLLDRMAKVTDAHLKKKA